MATTKKKSRSSKSKKKNSSSLKSYFFKRSLNNKLIPILFVVVMASLGAYLHFGGNAQGRAPDDIPGRGLIYNGVGPELHGPCAGQYETDSDVPNLKACTHIDPGPEDVDIRARAQKVDQELTDQANYDKQHPQKKDNPDPQDAAPVEPVTAADVGSKGDLSTVTGVNWPCTGTGTDGYRVKFVYAYQASGTNRLPSLRDNFAAIARRMNAVAYYSAQDSGGFRKIRFATEADCSLRIVAIPITGDINSYTNVKHDIKAAISELDTRKYVVEIDGGTKCGQGDVFGDTRSTQDNYNNGSGGDMYAMIWKGCWDYAEPHEFMHTLGAVQPSAPYATSGYHCYDQHDVMCYNDGSGKGMQVICGLAIKKWRYDCGHNTYFDAGTTSGWLSTHWNTADSRWFKNT